MPAVQIPDMPKIGKIEAQEMQLYWESFFTSEEYRDKLKERINKGKAAHMEILLHHMVYGKPKETLALQGGGDGNFVLVIGGQTQVQLSVDAAGMVRKVLPEIAEGTVIDAEPANGNGHAQEPKELGESGD
jgi:hypothetical protein